MEAGEVIADTDKSVNTFQLSLTWCEALAKLGSPANMDHRRKSTSPVTVHAAVRR